MRQYVDMSNNVKCDVSQPHWLLVYKVSPKFLYPFARKTDQMYGTSLSEIARTSLLVVGEVSVREQMQRLKTPQIPYKRRFGRAHLAEAAK